MRRLAVALVVAGALAAPASAHADWTPGEYRGGTSQGHEARMGFNETHVFRHGFEVEMKCTKPRRGKRPARRREGGRYTSGRAIRLDADGRFESRSRRGRFKTHFAGQVTGAAATGTFQLTLKANGWTCKSPRFAWRVERLGQAPSGG